MRRQLRLTRPASCRARRRIFTGGTCAGQCAGPCIPSNYRFVWFFCVRHSYKSINLFSSQSTTNTYHGGTAQDNQFSPIHMETALQPILFPTDQYEHHGRMGRWVRFGKGQITYVLFKFTERLKPDWQQQQRAHFLTSPSHPLPPSSLHLVPSSPDLPLPCSWHEIKPFLNNSCVSSFDWMQLVVSMMNRTSRDRAATRGPPDPSAVRGYKCSCQ